MKTFQVTKPQDRYSVELLREDLADVADAAEMDEEEGFVYPNSLQDNPPTITVLDRRVTQTPQWRNAVVKYGLAPVDITQSSTK